jgi:hypothetical protein
VGKGAATKNADSKPAKVKKVVAEVPEQEAVASEKVVERV